MSIVGLIAYVVKISMDYSKLKTIVEEERKRATEDRLKNSKKFEDYFNYKAEVAKDMSNFKKDVSTALVELTTTIKMMSNNIDQQFKQLEKKFDELGGNK